MKKNIIIITAVIVLLLITYKMIEHFSNNGNRKNERISSDFIRGADISTLKQLEEEGIKFYNEDGKEQELMSILKSYGVNWIRIRIWVNPLDDFGKAYGCGHNDKATTLELAKRAKELGLKVLLDFHYSDFWADPGKQNKPKDWKDLEGVELENKVYEYTKDILLSLKEINAMPQMVQIGNEVNNGILWPNGKIYDIGNEGYEDFSNLLKAGIRASKEVNSNTLVMIHLAEGTNNKLFRKMFDNLTEKNVPYDIIGVSYYPYWHGSFEDLEKNLNDISKRYNKDVIIAETAYAYTLENFDSEKNIFNPSHENEGKFLASVLGQENVIRKIINILGKVENNRGKGFFYWEPAWIVQKSSTNKIREVSGWENQAMFDFNGKALSSLNAFSTDPKAPIEEGTIIGFKTLELTAIPGRNIVLPKEVYAIKDNGSLLKVNVQWDEIPSKFLETKKVFKLKGKIKESRLRPKITIKVFR